MTDQELLREYVEARSQAAFAELVERHKHWVYSTCLRRLNNAHMAEDAAQATFITLARKAKSLVRHASLAGWLYQTACFTAADARKLAARRARHEMEAVMRQTLAAAESNDKTWERIAPLLEPALDRLPEKHRLPILLRFYERKTHPQIAEVLGISEDAAKKRLERALDLLRSTLQAKGVVFPAAALAALLLANTVQAAPVTLTASATLASLAAGTGATWALSQGALHMIFWSQAKAAIVVVSVAGGLTAGGVAVNHAMAQRQPMVVAQAAPAANAAPDAWDASPAPAAPAATSAPISAPPPAAPAVQAAPAAPDKADGQTPSTQPSLNVVGGGVAAENLPAGAVPMRVNAATGTLVLNAVGNGAAAAGGNVAAGNLTGIGIVMVAGTLTLNNAELAPSGANDVIAAVDTFDKSLAQLDAKKTTAMLYAENQDEKDYVGAYEQLIKSVSQVKAALAEQKILVTEMDAILQNKLSPLPISHADVEVAEISDDNTRATIRPAGQKPPLVMVHQEDAWKIPVKSLFAGDALVPATAAAKQTAQNLEALAGEIKAGKVRTYRDFQLAYNKAWGTP